MIVFIIKEDRKLVIESCEEVGLKVKEEKDLNKKRQLPFNSEENKCTISRKKEIYIRVTADK